MAVKVVVPKLNRTPIQDNLDLRDAVHALVGKGGSDLKDQDTQDNFKWIAGLKGLPFAQKLFSHISVFNQQNQNMSPQDKIERFYTQGSKDPEIQTFVSGLAGLGGKPVVTDSHLVNNIGMGMGVPGAVAANEMPTKKTTVVVPKK